MKCIPKIFPKNNADVCAVITSYRSDKGFYNRVDRVQAQAGLVVIVIDDGVVTDEKAKLNKCFLNNPKIIIYCLPANLGIAVALNVGISIAKQQGYRWVLTLDDDTMVMPNLIEHLIGSWQLVSRQGGKPLAAIGPLYADAHTGLINGISKEKSFMEKRGVITSGCMLSLDVYDIIGPFREEFFIDSIDYDFCMRARAKGYRILQVSKIGMIHSLGRAKQYRFGWFKVQTTNHNAMRRYYMCRNSTVLAMEHFLHDPFYSLAVFFSQLKMWFLVLFLEEDKYLKIRFMFRGTLDGWRKKLGKVV